MRRGLTTDEVRRELIEEAGMLGISGVSGDLRDVEAAANAGNDNARGSHGDLFLRGEKIYRGVYRRTQWGGRDRFRGRNW